MANEKRLRVNSIGGLIEDNPLTNAATTLTSAALAALPVVDTTNHCAIVLDPDGIEGAPEIAWITAHTAAATTATIARAQEDTGALQHSQGIPWVHAPTVKDYDGAGGGVGLIGLKNHRPVSDTATYSISTNTPTDVDAINLAVSFTAPPSGRVLVRLNGSKYASAGDQHFWSVRLAAANIAEQYVSSLGTSLHHISAPFYIGGLTPGAALTYKWGWRQGSGTAYLYGGPTMGAFVMEVWAVNL